MEDVLIALLCALIGLFAGLGSALLAMSYITTRLSRLECALKELRVSIEAHMLTQMADEEKLKAVVTKIRTLKNGLKKNSEAILAVVAAINQEQEKDAGKVFSEMGQKSQEIQHKQGELITQAIQLLKQLHPQAGGLFSSMTKKKQMMWIKKFAKGDLGMIGTFIPPEMQPQIETAQKFLMENFGDIIGMDDKVTKKAK